MKTLYVLCREPLPHRRDGWHLVVGPVLVEPEVLVDGEVQLTTLKLTSPTFSGALVAEAVGEVVARHTRGLVIAEPGLAVIADHTEAEPNESVLHRELEELLEAASSQSSREANDWSDVAQLA